MCGQNSVRAKINFNVRNGQKNGRTLCNGKFKELKLVEQFSESEILDPILGKFIESIDEILNVFANFGSQVTLHNNFSKLLMHVQPGFMQHL